MVKINNILKKQTINEILFLVVIAGVLSLIFQLSLTQASVLGSSIFTVFLLEKFFIYRNPQEYLIIAFYSIIGMLCAYYIDSIGLIPVVLIGINTTVLYLNDYKIDRLIVHTGIVNLIVLANVILSSALEKFRGFNKLDTQSVEQTIIFIVVSFLTVFFLYKFLKSVFKKVYKKYKFVWLFIITTILIVTFGLMSHYIYKEVGFSLIFVPLLLGVLSGLLDNVDEKFFPVPQIIQIAAVVIYSYSISGLLGVTISILSAFLFIVLFNEDLDLNANKDSLIFSLIPLAFLFAISELRENQGQITRFRMTTGYQIGWLFISGLIMISIPNIINFIERVLHENKIEKLLQPMQTLFTILALTVIIKNGKTESMAAFMILSSLYYLFESHLAEKKHYRFNYYVLLIGTLAGSYAFLLLSRL